MQHKNMNVNFHVDCMREKYGWSSYTDEHGFFYYTLDGDLVVREFWIRPESRASIKVYRDYLKMMDEIASLTKCKSVIISIFMDAKNDLKDNTLALALRAGFKLDRLQGESHIVLKREL